MMDQTEYRVTVRRVQSPRTVTARYYSVDGGLDIFLPKECADGYMRLTARDLARMAKHAAGTLRSGRRK